MALSEHYRKAMVIFWYKLAMLVVLSSILMYAIVYVGAFYTYFRSQWPTLKDFYVLMFMGLFVLLFVEAAMLILLGKAIKQRSFTKSRLWVILTFVFLILDLIVFIFEASSGWTSVNSLMLIFFLLEIVCLKVMFDFMAAVRGRGRSDVAPPLPLTPAPSVPPMVEIPLTTFKMNDLNVPYSYSNWNSSGVIP